MQRLFWYRPEALMALNSLGYKHFITKKQCKPCDFNRGQAFYYDEDKMEYGRLDMISSSYKDCDSNLERILGPPNTKLTGASGSESSGQQGSPA